MKNKIIAGILSCAFALTTMSMTVLAADTSAPTATGMAVYGVNSSGATVALPTNNESEVWTKYPTLQARLSGVTDATGVKEVVFCVVNWNYPMSYSTTYVTGERIGTSTTWKANIPVGGNTVTIQAFPADTLGNTELYTMGGNSSYKFTKSVYGDFNTPSGYVNFETSGNHYIDVNQKYITNSLQVKVKVQVNDSEGAPWACSNVKSVSVKLYKNGSTTATTYQAKYMGSSTSRCGEYEYVFNQSDEAAENTYKAVVTITDYAGNSYTTEPKYFVIDRLRPSGTVTTNSSLVTGDSFDVYLNDVSEATYVDKVWFPTWTSANGQDELIWYEGIRTGEKQWKITINRANHNYEKGEYITHVYTQDYLGNFGIVGYTTVTLQ